MTQPYAHRTLPEGYDLYRTLDLIKDRKLLLILSAASLGLFLACWAGLVWLLQQLRPDLTPGRGSFEFRLSGIGGVLIPLLVLLGVVFAMVIVHEAIHGVCFWLFTGGRVKFAFKGAYAYAAAPDWYVYKQPYKVVSLAPLVLITVLGLLALLWVPANWVAPLMLLIAMNASGAVGDIYVVFLLTKLPGEALVQDFGEQMLLFTRNETHLGGN
ncbi:MAG: DUF3267 domain-containing protein [Brevefilum sp.]|nr:DUF3267 domain-containing protein [Brevefilum sp.]